MNMTLPPSLKVFNTLTNRYFSVFQKSGVFLELLVASSTKPLLTSALFVCVDYARMTFHIKNFSDIVNILPLSVARRDPESAQGLPA